MTAALPVPEPDVPFPPRYWWLKRLSGGFVLFVLLLVGLWFAWSGYADRMLRGELRAIHDRGEPIYVDDFAPKTVADESNGAKSLEDAAAALAALPPKLLDFFDTYNTQYAPSATVLANLPQAVTSATIPRQLVRAARRKPKTQWNLTFRSPVIKQLMSGSRSQRQLGGMLECTVFVEHTSGNDAEAGEAVRDLLFQSDRLHDYGPSYQSYTLAMSISLQAADAVRIIAPGLSCADQSGASSRPAGPASRAQVRALIDAFLDESAFRSGFARAVTSERLMLHDLAEHPAGFRLIMDVPPFIDALRPALKLEAIRDMHYMDRGAAASELPTYSAATKALPPHPRNPTATIPTQLVQFMSNVGLSFSNAIDKHFQGLAERRVAAIRLAIRLYQLDHEGSLPARLEDLAPEYLPSLPPDPHAADTRTFGYRTTPRPFLYGLGHDGKDGGGDAALEERVRKWAISTVEPGSSSDLMRWDRMDVIFPINQQLDVEPPAATQPAE